jgi:hypothetical protein
MDRASTFKLQRFMWTVVVVLAYVAIWAARALGGNFDPITGIRQNPLIAMGLTVTTMAAPKPLTVRRAFVSWRSLIKA